MNMNALDIFLAVIVIATIAVFGTMLALGNERQRRAIQAVADHAGRWAEQDLQLKRARASRDIHVEDPRAWLDGIATQLFGISPGLTQLYPWIGNEEAVAMVGVCGDGRRLVVTPIPPERFVRAAASRKVRGRGASAVAATQAGLLGERPRSIPVHELTVVTAGAFFDLEAGQVWDKIFSTKLGVDRLFLFEVPARSA
jgi:hypothetical protein